MDSRTYIDEMFSVADEKVPEDPRLIQIPQSNHVLHPVDGGGVHRLDVRGILGRDPVFLKIMQIHKFNAKENTKKTTPKNFRIIISSKVTWLVFI